MCRTASKALGLGWRNQVFEVYVFKRQRKVMNTKHQENNSNHAEVDSKSKAHETVYKTSRKTMKRKGPI